MGRCETHGLAVGPDGRCVLCKRAEAPVSVPASDAPSPPPELIVISPATLATAALGIVALVVAGVVGWHMLAARSAGASSPERTADDGPSVVMAAPVRSAADHPHEHLEPPAHARWGETADSLPSAPPPAVGVRAVTPPNEGAPAPAAVRTPSPEEQAQALEAARRRVDIIMYSTDWCPHCKEARAYMRSHGIIFVERDVEKDSGAERRQMEINPKGGVPTFEVDDEVLVGFSPAALEHTIDEAARKRLARR